MSQQRERNDGYLGPVDCGEAEAHTNNEACWCEPYVYQELEDGSRLYVHRLWNEVGAEILPPWELFVEAITEMAFAGGMEED
jgi:hypothetical protein